MQCGLLLVLTFGIFAVPYFGQTPTWSRGILNLPISYDECKSRARRVLEAEGYTIENQGGGNPNGDYYFAGYKDIHNAVIACNSSPNRATWANVFVASCLNTRNGDVPGAERVKLQRRMSQSFSGGCGLGTRWRIISDGGWSGFWTRRGSSEVFDAVWTRGSEQFTAVVTIRIEDNRVNIRRRNATLGGDCELNGILGEDGVTVTGTNVCTQGSAEFRAVIECVR